MSENNLINLLEILENRIISLEQQIKKQNKLNTTICDTLENIAEKVMKSNKTEV